MFIVIYDDDDYYLFLVLCLIVINFGIIGEVFLIFCYVWWMGYEINLGIRKDI